MAVLADPVVDALLDEFKQAVAVLMASASSVAVPAGARLDVVKQLCELSRYVRFHLGPAKYADPEQLSNVADAFENAVKVIESVWKDKKYEVQDYCSNIMDRAKYCRLS